MYRSAIWCVPSGIGIRMPRSSATAHAGAGRPLRDCRVKNLTCLGSLTVRSVAAFSLTSSAITGSLPERFAYIVRKVEHTRLRTAIAKGAEDDGGGTGGGVHLAAPGAVGGRPPRAVEPGRDHPGRA